MQRFLIGVLATLVLASPAAAAPDLSKMGAAELAAFMKAFPKGGELHNHLSGAIYGETLLNWAAEDGLCVDMKALAIRQVCANEDYKPAKEVIADEALRSLVVDSVSTRHPGFRDRSGHDQFFSSFGRMGMKPSREGDALAVVMGDLARQNTFYLELMVTPMFIPSRALGGQVGWRGDAAKTRAALTEAGLEKLVPRVEAHTDTLQARAREVLKCGTPEAKPGCQVTVRFLFQAIRQGKPEETMAQLQLGVATVAADARWVGLQLVAPEDSQDAVTHYDTHMKIVDLLTDHGRKTPVSLHAGELTLDVAPPEVLSYHIAAAVRVAGARRIGHGVDLPHEPGAEALAAEMAARGVLVEVNLISNREILGVQPEAHPYAWLRTRGVPVAISTDDAGILRSDLSGDYALAVRTGATYDDLKTAARNGIAYSFLAGEGLWRDPNVYRKPATACAGQVGNAEPKGACAALVAKSDKAREQWRHEKLLREFEAGF